MYIGENLKYYRKKAGLTQKQLGDACGLAAITIRQYESNKREPQKKQTGIIAEKLGIAEYLLYAPVHHSKPIGDSVFEGTPTDLEFFSKANRLKHFGDLLEANDIKYQICEQDGRAGKLFSFNKKEGFKYFLTNEQARQLPEMSIEQIKTLIRNLDQLNKQSESE